MVRAARHCCVCHRYKGLKVEVHHIIQEADAGPNTLDNAIALCADCHTDAGHYNPKHPRGTKFSPEELRLARDRWHQTVHRGAIPTPTDSSSLYCRYLVCKTFSAIREVIGENLSDFPFESPMLMRTPVFEFLTSIVEKQKGHFRVPHEWGAGFQSEEEYVRTHPDAQKTSDMVTEGQHFLGYERTPTLDELREIVGPMDYVSSRLLETSLEATEVCRIRAAMHGCDNVLIREEYRLRPLWVVYLVITNDSDQRIRLVGLDAYREAIESPSEVSNVNASHHRTLHTIPFPSAEIPVNSSVVLPIATILGPIEELAGEDTWTAGKRVSTGEMQELSHGSIPTAAITNCLYWGPVVFPVHLRFIDSGMEHIQEMHQLDLRNLYVLDRRWMVGSCPHLFAINENGAVRYLGEIFAASPGIPQSASVVIEQGVKYLVLAELEDERTLVRSVSQGNMILAEQVLLERGDCLVIPIEGDGPVTLTGQYDLVSLPPVYAKKNLDRVRLLIRSFAIFLGEAFAFDRHLLVGRHSHPTEMRATASVSGLMPEDKESEG